MTEFRSTLRVGATVGGDTRVIEKFGLRAGVQDAGAAVLDSLVGMREAAGVTDTGVPGARVWDPGVRGEARVGIPNAGPGVPGAGVLDADVIEPDAGAGITDARVLDVTAGGAGVQSPDPDAGVLSESAIPVSCSQYQMAKAIGNQ